MENRKHTSLKDLAQALGVSIPTVSRALKDSPEISRELCAKAKALAKEMNYRPNPFAMSLRKNAPRIIGVVVPDIVTHFFASILNGIENMAIANGYFVIITTSHESYEHEKRNIENLFNCLRILFHNNLLSGSHFFLRKDSKLWGYLAGHIQKMADCILKFSACHTLFLYPL